MVGASEARPHDLRWSPLTTEAGDGRLAVPVSLRTLPAPPLKAFAGGSYWPVDSLSNPWALPMIRHRECGNPTMTWLHATRSAPRQRPAQISSHFAASWRCPGRKCHAFLTPSQVAHLFQVSINTVPSSNRRAKSCTAQHKCNRGQQPDSNSPAIRVEHGAARIHRPKFASIDQ